MTPSMANAANEQSARLSPTAAIIDSQSVKSAERGGLTTRMATMRARRSKARSGIFLSTHQGLLMHAIVHPRRCSGPRRGRAPDGDIVRPSSLPSEAVRRWRISRGAVPGCAGGHSQAREHRDRQTLRSSPTASSSCPNDGSSSEPSPGSDDAERLAKDWECLNRKALAFLKLASIRLMTRKLCNSR